MKPQIIGNLAGSMSQDLPASEIATITEGRAIRAQKTDTEIIQAAQRRYSTKYVQRIAESEEKLEELKITVLELGRKAAHTAHEANIAKSQEELARIELETLKSKESRSQELEIANGRAYKKRDKHGRPFSSTPHPHYCEIRLSREVAAFRACSLADCPRNRC